MKKLICLILTLIILVSLAACSGTFSTPDDPKNPYDPENPYDPKDPDGSDKGAASLSISGIDAAKLLLAEERLNAQLLKNEGDIFENGVKVMNDLASKAAANLDAKKQSDTIKLGGGFRMRATDSIPLGSLGEEKRDIGKMEVLGDTVEWTDLGEVSNSYEYFLNLTNNIVASAEACSDLIDFIKKNIRIVDKWVELAEERYYLSVGENEELLCNERGVGEDRYLIICRRYRNEAGKDVYEMYHSSGSSYERRMTYIPGERYEISDCRNQHFIATNTKGYWENYVVGAMETHYNISYLILKDDICYTFGFINDKFPTIDVISSDRQTDLFTYSPGEESTMFALKLNGFTNIERITSPKANVEFGPDGSYANLQWNDETEIHVKGGNVIKQTQSYCDGDVLVTGIIVMALSYGYGAEMHIAVNGTPDVALARFKQFLNETGLDCSRDINTVLEGARRSMSDSMAVFNYYQWNGYTVNNQDNVGKGHAAEIAKYDAIISLYDAVKDAETVIYDRDNSDLELYMSFAPIVKNEATGAAVIGNRLAVESLTLTVNDVSLFVNDEPYRVVIALEDSSGGIIHLEQTSSGEVRYSGEAEFSITVSDVEITIPALTEGSYRAVAYIATSDGIRSSAFDGITVGSVDGVPLTLGDVDLTASVDPKGGLTLTYTGRVDVEAALQSEGTLSYDAFRQLICELAFKYGIPDESCIEVLQGEEYVALNGSETEIASGNYRVAYTVENGDLVRGGHVYVKYSAIPAPEIEEG